MAVPYIGIIPNDLGKKMALTETTEIDKVEIVGPYKIIQVRYATIVKKDGVEIARSNHRTSYTPEATIAATHASTVNPLVDQFHTSEVITAYNNATQEVA